MSRLDGMFIPCRLVAIALTLALGGINVAWAQVNIYATKVPAGSSYVRVADGDGKAANVAIGSLDPVALAPNGTVVTAYHLIPGGKSITITIDGKVHLSLAIPPNKYLTVIYRPTTNGPQLTTIADNPGDDNGVLAELRFYNLVPGCDGSLTLGNGTAVFGGVGVNESKSRSINPVAATLVPKCGPHAGTPIKLPLLKAQSRYSIFLVGNGSKPNAAGNADAMEATK
jgi:alginate O-acetyltransferase complex protein AlgF